MDKRTPTKNKPDLLDDRSIDRVIYRDISPVEVTETNPVLEKLISEGCENFFQYFELLGLANNTDLIVLPSTHHYYYDGDDLRDVKTVVNMKHLNQIKNIRDFLHSIYHTVSHQSFFIGVFIDRKYQNGFFSNSTLDHPQIKGRVDPVENGIESRIPFLNLMYNLMDSKTNRYMSRQAVTLLLSDAGFKVLDITELNRLTFFCTQKVKLSGE